MNMKNAPTSTRKFGTLLGALAFAAAVTAQAADDKDFVKDAAKGNQFEVQAGQLAEQQGKSDMVKNLGQKISSDHQKANDQLKQVASQKNVDIPKEPANKGELDDLKDLSGDEFDKKYVELMVDDHKKDIEKYQKQAEESNDPAVKKYAEDNIAVLREHLQMSEQTQAALEKETAVGGSAPGGEGDQGGEGRSPIAK
jgi:putative membrane protein